LNFRTIPAIFSWPSGSLCPPSRRNRVLFLRKYGIYLISFYPFTKQDKEDKIILQKTNKKGERENEIREYCSGPSIGFGDGLRFHGRKKD
jgi:hypothetical protein